MVGFGGGIGAGFGFTPGFSSVDENFPISAAAFFNRSSLETIAPAGSFLVFSFSFSLRTAFNLSIRDLASWSSRPLDGVLLLMPILSRTEMRSLLSTPIFLASSCTLITVIKSHAPRRFFNTAFYSTHCFLSSLLIFRPLSTVRWRAHYPLFRSRRPDHG